MIKFLLIRNVKKPNRNTSNDAGIDFYIPSDWNDGKEYTILPGESVLIPSGVKTRFSKGYMLVAHNKSGVASKKGLIVGSSVVDYGYQGEIHINLWNVSNKPVTIAPNEKIVQFILVPAPSINPEFVESFEELWETKTERGENGFGSSDNT
jgi:dUTP pyrophosphatase